MTSGNDNNSAAPFDLQILSQIAKMPGGESFLYNNLCGRVGIVLSKAHVWEGLKFSLLPASAGKTCLFTANLVSHTHGPSPWMPGEVNLFLDGKKLSISRKEIMLINPNKNLLNLSFVFTGIMPYERNFYKTVTVLKGGKYKNQMSKKVDFLVTNQPAATGKYSKALEYGVPIITESKFMALARKI